MTDGDGDQGDIAENFYWSCAHPGCGEGGSAASMANANDARTLHMAFCDKAPNSKDKKK